MTRIGDLLASDDAVLRELEYVATNGIKAEYKRLFSAMTGALNSPDEGVGIWISGPPGSGKSAFVKNLGHVLGNRDIYGAPAAALFLNRQESGQVAEGVEYFNRSIPYQIFRVNLRAELALETPAEHIVEAMYLALLRELDYAEDYDISELEIQLEKDSKLASFQDLCREEYKKEWREIRKGGQKFACASLLLYRLAPQTYDSTDAWLKTIRARLSARPGAKDLVNRTFELSELRSPGKAFAFMVDEIGPYAILGGERIENLRAVVEQFGRESLRRRKAGKIPGPIWIVIVAQEKLQEVSNHLAASRVARTKLEDHFIHQIELSPHDVREVVALSALRKRENQEPVLRQLFHDNAASLISNVELEHSTHRSELDEDRFVRFYPYLPHMIDLSMEILAGIRLHSNRVKQFAKSHPTIIQLCSGVLGSNQRRLIDQPAGALVSIDDIYELLEANIPPEKRKEVREVRQRFDDHPDLPGMAGRVAKAICLMEFVQTDLPRTTNNIAALLIQKVSEERPTLAVSKILQQLKEAQFVRETEAGWTLYDFDELRRRVAGLKDLRNAVGAVNPRLPGVRNELIQSVKRLLARFLRWYTGPLYEFNASVSRTLEEVVFAVDHLTTSLIALDRLSVKEAFDHLPVNLAGIEEQLAQLDKPDTPVSESLLAHVGLLRQQVNVLADLQKTVSLEAPPERMEMDQSLGKDSNSPVARNKFQGDGLADQGRCDMQWGRHDGKDRTAYFIGLFGTGRRYINELLIGNIGERAKYFRDGIRLHPGPTPMIYSGHVTMKYVSRAQESPVIMRYIQEAVRSRFADSIFIYRHPLDSLLTNWIWWRTYIRDNRAISGIAEVYSKTDDLCADLEKNFLEFNSFAAGEPAFFAASPGSRFLSFPEFVEESELHQRSATLALRLEDFMIDPAKEFSKALAVMSADVDLSQSSLTPPRAKPYGHLAVKAQVPRFRNFIDGLDGETKRRIETIGYSVS